MEFLNNQYSNSQSNNQSNIQAGNKFINQSPNNISIYLDKYKNIGFEKVSYKKIIIGVIKDVCDIDLKNEDVSIQNKILKIKVSGVLKTEIFIHQNDIEKELDLRLKSLNLNFENRRII